YQADDLNSSGEKFDLVFDAAAKLKLEQAKSLVHEGGRVVSTRAEPKQVVESIIERFRGAFKMSFMMVKPRSGDIAFLLRLLETGRLTPVVHKTFALDQIADAHTYLESESV